MGPWIINELTNLIFILTRLGPCLTFVTCLEASWQFCCVRDQGSNMALFMSYFLHLFICLFVFVLSNTAMSCGYRLVTLVKLNRSELCYRQVTHVDNISCLCHSELHCQALYNNEVHCQALFSNAEW